VDLLAALRSAAAQAGLTGLGVASAAPFAETRRVLEQRVAAGLHGGFRSTYRHPATATDVRASFPWAERLVVGCRAYLPAAGSPGPARPGTGRVARFAGEDHYHTLRVGLETLAEVLHEMGHRGEVLCDDARLVDRAAAVRAGVGWWGRSAMVVSPRQGPWLLLGSVATDAPLPEAVPSREDCGTCTACLPACPTGALVAPGVLDARRCLSALTQSPEVIPEAFRRAMGDRLYGCDACLEVCPPGRELLSAAAEGVGRIDLAEVLWADDGVLLRRFGHWNIPRRDPRYLRRNALVVLGNAGGGAGAVEAAAAYLRHDDPLLRGHAAWALGELGGTVARVALGRAAERERDPEALEEIRRAAAEADRGPGADGTRRGGSVD
jgi:epoxyqueuosine reductase